MAITPTKLAEAKDNPWQDLMFRFDGSWMPDVDGSLIGPQNYQELENLRYKDSGLEGVNGYTKVNTTAIATYTNIRTGHQLRTDKTQDSYILVNSTNTAGQGRVHLNRTAPGSAGQFQTAAQVAAYTVPALNTSGNEYFQDVSTGLTGRFSDAPQGNVAYCNGEQSMIFGGDEQRIAAAFTAVQTHTSLLDDANNGVFTNPSDWTNVDYPAPGYSETTDLSLDSSAAGQYCTLAALEAPTAIGSDYVLTISVSSLTGTFLIKDFTGAQTICTIIADGTDQKFNWTATTLGGFRIVAGATNSIANFDNIDFHLKYHGDEIDVTDALTNSLHLTTGTDMVTLTAAARDTLIVCTTRPAAGFKIYVDSGNVNAVAGAMQLGTWNGTRNATLLIANDGTATAGATLAKTGYITLTSHSEGTAKVHHEKDLYLYTYYFTLNAGDADIYQVTYNPAMQTVKDVWDGVYRQPIQFQVVDALATFDYTLQVNESSDQISPVGGELLDAGTDAADKLYIMFEDQMAAIKFTMLADKVNNDAAVSTMKYWDGDSWVAVSHFTDGTIGIAGATLSQSGLFSWTPPTDEVAQSAYSSFGYMYQIDFSAALGNAITTPSVLVDVCNGIPQQLKVKPFKWSALYGTRLMLGGYVSGDEGNRMDYSVANAPDVFNGFDSSDNSKQSLYYGGVEDIVAGTQLYNRFGASIYTMLLVLKRNETYILIGDTPDSFVIYDVAKTIGCVAPKSLATAEIGLDLGNGLTRNVAIWLSHSGPMMFDGAILSPIPGVRSYFDPNDAKYIDFDLVSKAVGWVDPNYKEYNLLIPSGSTASNNTWLVYDLVRRKWFTKTTGQAAFPQTGFEVGEPDTGRRYIYSGIDTGYMLELENSTYWDDGTAAGIAQKVKTGDFFPTNNIWDETTIRKFKIYIKKLVGSSVDNVMQVLYYTNTETNPGSGILFQDGAAAWGGAITWTDTDGVEWASAVSATVDLNLDVGLQRLVRITQDLGKKGWAHAFEFRLTTTDVTKGFSPVLWGVQYRVERKDNTSSE